MHEIKTYLIKPNKMDIESFNPRFYEPNFRFVKEQLEFCSKLDVYLSNEPKGGSTPPYYIFKDFVDNEIPFVKTSAISRDFLNMNDLHYIHSKYHKKELKRSITKSNDVIFSMTGKFMGKAALVPQCIKEINMSQNSVVLTTEDKFKSAYLTLFLNSEINKTQVRGLYTISKQKYLNQGKIRNLKIVPYDPSLEPILEKYIDGVNLYYDAVASFQTAINAINIYFKARTDITKVKKVFYQKPNLLNHNLLTPEYYCHDYRTILDYMKSNVDSWTTLDNYVTPQVGEEIGSDNYLFEGVPYIKTSDCLNYNVDYQPNYYCSEGLYYSLDQNIQFSDILLAKDGKIGETAFITDGAEFVYCGGLVKLQSGNLEDQMMLFTILASMIGQIQLKRWSVIASTMAHLRRDFFTQCIVPDLPDDLKNIVLQNCYNGIKLRKTSLSLIKESKEKVNEYFLSFNNL